jgi:hypothetical protein
MRQPRINRLWMTRAGALGRATEPGYCLAMRQYHDLEQRVLTEGTRMDDRAGTGVLAVFGHQMRFDLAQGFPLVTTKTLRLKSIVHELIWFLHGDTNVRTRRRTASGPGTTGRRQWRSQLRLRTAVALLAGEIRRNRTRGAVPLPVPALRAAAIRWPRQALLPALPALGRCLSRRALPFRRSERRPCCNPLIHLHYFASVQDGAILRDYPNCVAREI